MVDMRSRDINPIFQLWTLHKGCLGYSYLGLLHVIADVDLVVWFLGRFDKQIGEFLDKRVNGGVGYFSVKCVNLLYRVLELIHKVLTKN